MPKKVFLLLVWVALCGQLSARLRELTPYNLELTSALESPNSFLGRTAKIGTSSALALLRHAAWADYFKALHHRLPSKPDCKSYFLLEDIIAPFADRAYPLMPEDFPLLYGLVNEYAATLLIAPPLVILVDDWKLVDAASASWNTDSGFIILTKGLFQEANAKQLSGALLHQMGLIAKQTTRKRLRVLVPTAVIGFTLLLAAIYFLKGDMLTLKRGLACLGLASLYGLIVAVVNAWLCKKAELKGDSTLAQHAPDHGIELIKLFQQCHKEDFGGDIEAVESLIGGLSHVAPADLENTMQMLEGMRQALEKTDSLQTYTDSGLFGAHRPLSVRLAFFERALREQEGGQPPQ